VIGASGFGALFAFIVVVTSGCAADPGVVTVPAPRALVACEQRPADLAAELWVSGSDEPCGLDVDDAGAAAGACDVTPGTVRVLTLDWFVTRPFDGDDVRVLLAQARGELDLTRARSADATFTVSPDDVVYSRCLDMREDSFQGSPTTTFDGEERPPCDLDDSCPADSEEVTCANVGEVCEGEDPLG
jgi:hypothetical protein